MPTHHRRSGGGGVGPDGPIWQSRGPLEKGHLSRATVEVHAGATIRLAAHEMLARHIHLLVVIADDGAPIGVVTPLDLLRSILEDPDTPIS
jgi:CBS domain-containing protein